MRKLKHGSYKSNIIGEVGWKSCRKIGNALLSSLCFVFYYLLYLVQFFVKQRIRVLISVSVYRQWLITQDLHVNLFDFNERIKLENNATISLLKPIQKRYEKFQHTRPCIGQSYTYDEKITFKRHQCYRNRDSTRVLIKKFTEIYLTYNYYKCKTFGKREGTLLHTVAIK